MKRVFALLLTLAMLLGLMPTAMAAEVGQAGPGTTVQATELPGVSRLDGREPSGGQRPAAGPQYKDDDIVTVIVQLDEPSLLEYYNQMGGQAVFGADNTSGEEYTAGEAVSAFFGLSEIQDAAEDMLAEQQSVLSQIGGLQATTFSARGAEPEVEVVAQWTAALNGMAVRVPYGSLSAIRAIDGVKRAYVQHTYDAPEPVMSGAGNAGFSYDMVNLNAVWQAGYTGKGMLVAVVDTGLDLEYTDFSIDGDSGEPDDFINVTDIRRTHEAFRGDSFQSHFPDAELRYTRTSMGNFLSSHTLNAHRLTSPIAVNEAAYKNRKVVYAFDYAGVADPYTGEILSGDVNVYPGQEGNTHGTHVAGTIAGYAKTDEGAVIFSGVAPDAQLAIMKVFADEGGGATDSAILNALDDALKLGVDVVNLSLGSDNGFADDDTAQVGVYASLEKAGLILMTSAGNSAFSSSHNKRGNYNLSGDPEISMMSAPAVYPSNLSVASINNSVDSQMTLVWSDGDNEYTIPFTDPFDVAMKSDFAPAKMPAEGIEIIPAGVGNYSDYANANFDRGWGGGKTGIALVQRGGIKEYTDPEENLSFVDKVKNAGSFTSTNSQGERFGVKAVLIYDHSPGDLINMGIKLSDGVDLASAFISKEAGDAMIAAINEGKTVTLKWVNQEDRIVDYEKSGEMSEFTSWGAGPALDLKPEITAPGGNIWSTVFDTTYREGTGYYNDYTGSYAMMSGTSMAAPHMSGLGALVRQYVQVNRLASGADAASLTSRLLVSTAVPQAQKEEGSDKTALYSPRQQGAGLVNVEAAITTPAYITVDGQMVGKLELKDDPEWTGSYDLKFKVHNLTGSPVTYNVQAAMQRPATKTEGGHTFMLDSDTLIKTVDLGTVTVPANGEATVTRTIYLSQAEINTLKDLFPNGTYIEGFITLTNDSDPQIGLPYLAFLGDWTAAPIIDTTLWCDENPDDPDWNPWDNGDYTWFPTVIGSAIIGQYEILGWLNLGQNIFDETSDTTQKIYHKGNLTISPDGNGYFDVIDDIELYQLRDAKLMVVEVRDVKTNELYFRDFATYNFKTLYDSSAGAVIPSSLYYFTGEDWAGTDLDGNLLPSGTKCVYTITAYGEGEYGSKVTVDGYNYPVTNFEGVDPTKPGTEPTFNGHPMDKTGDVISFPVVVDYEAPKLENSAVSIVERDGRTYLTGTVYDVDGSLASIEVVPVVTRTYSSPYADPTYAETSRDLNNPFYSKLIYDEAVKEWHFEADVTEYTHTNQSYEGENYTYNFEWTGAVHIDCGDYGANDRTYVVQVEGMAQQGEILLSQSSAKLHTGNTFELSVIDNTGSGTPITRTSTNPEVATVDEFGNVVAVAPGQATIVVTNGESTAHCVVAVEDWPTEVIDFDLSIEHFDGLKPNGIITVKVANLQPADVILDEIRWEVSEDDPGLYEGLITCERYSSDGLSAWIYLDYAATNDPNTHVPGADGTLRVTLNGVTREMKLNWEDLYTYYSSYGGQKDEDLVSAASSAEQTVYVTMGERAILVATYNDSDAHNVVPVTLYTAVGANDYQLNSTEPAEGLILDGPPFAGYNSEWRGKIVNKENYALPESIRVFTRYDDLETESGSSSFTYDSTTGEIVINYSYTNVVIRADGVAASGNPAGTLSGTEYEMPDGLYGPFDWAMTTGLPEGVTSVEGTLTPFEDELLPNGYNRGNGAYFTPSAPGVSYITAASKDGQYSVNFAVVCEPVKAESLDLNKHNVELAVGASEKLIPTFTPNPTLDADKELIWTSFSPDVATVDAQGNITAVSNGYAYIKAALKTDTTIQSYCIVTVGEGPNIEPQPITYVLNDGTISDTAPLWYITNDKAQTLNIPEPTKDGYVFTGWTYPGQSAPTKTVTLRAGLTGELTLTANWATPSTSNPSFTGGAGGGILTPPTTTTVVENPDGSTTTTVTDNRTGTVTETTENPNGSTEVVETKPDGTVTATTTDPEGGKVEKVVTPDEGVTITVTDKDGEELAKVEIPNQIPASPIQFVDVPEGHWAEDAINQAAGLGLVQGVGDDRFNLNGDMIRGDLAVVLCNLSNGSEGCELTFEDVPADKYYAGSVAWAAKTGVVSGYSDTEFGPENTITREELAVMLYRYAKLLKLDTAASADALDAFNDSSNTSSWAVDGMAWCVENEIIKGKGSDILDPGANATRAEVTVMLQRFMNLMK